MITSTKSLVRERLQAEGHLNQPWAGRVLDAMPEPAVAQQTHGGVFLKSLSVEGFRGIGPARELTLTPGPGLTLVVGRNGSGKSSFAEALEVLFTGTSQRWVGRAKIWQEGWRNLHQPHPSSITAGLILDGLGETTVTGSWDEAAPFETLHAQAQPKGKPRTTLDRFGWQTALESYRPFLSYNELSSMLDDGPSKLYDALSVVLGLDDLVHTQEALQRDRTDREKAVKAAEAERKQLVEKLKAFLESHADARASTCLAALQSKPWDLVALEAIVNTDLPADADALLAMLARAASLESPSAAQVNATVQAVREAAAGVAAVAGTDADHARELAELMTGALQAHSHHDDPTCPVCGTANMLTSDWVARSRAEVERLRTAAKASEAAHEAASRARRQAQQLLTPAPATLNQLANQTGLDLPGLAETQAAWRAWADGRSLTDLAALADHLESRHTALASAVDAIRIAAATERRRREDLWRPLLLSLAQWLPNALDAQANAEAIPVIKQAEAWLKDAATAIRNDRFAPIADKAMAAWKHLRQQSNVNLGRIELSGAKTQRRVTLDVTVDGVEGAALGVMSQGELHSLALSLFLPRATLDESPFRFVMVDDPVQSMDPARVDGLARALEDTARTRQVIVFTHDDRLPEATRRLGIAATILGVTRHPLSVVDVRTERHPVQAHIEDAFALIKTDELPDAVKRQVVPGFCRLALEAACVTVVRRRRLSAGKPHADVEAAIEDCRTTTQKAALALFDDPEKGSDVMSRLNRFGAWAGDVFKQCKDGAHTAATGDLLLMARDTEKLTQELLNLR